MEAHTGSTENPFTFVGKQNYYAEPDLGLYLIGVSYYDPLTGTWLRPDPAFSESNRFRYAGNNPVNMTDPSGKYIFTKNMGSDKWDLVQRLAEMGIEAHPLPIRVVGPFTDNLAYIYIDPDQIAKVKEGLQALGGSEEYINDFITAMNSSSYSILSTGAKDNFSYSEYKLDTSIINQVRKWNDFVVTVLKRDGVKGVSALPPEFDYATREYNPSNDDYIRANKRANREVQRRMVKQAAALKASWEMRTNVTPEDIDWSQILSDSVNLVEIGAQLLLFRRAVLRARMPAPMLPNTGGSNYQHGARTEPDMRVIAEPKLGTLKSTGPNTWESSGGLKYTGTDPDGLNRVAHVILHAENIPTRPGMHGVFDAGRTGTLSVVDEAWAIAQRGGPSVTVTQQGNRTAYTINMGKRVGYVGGQGGAAAGNPETNFVQLIIENGNQVITAFPIIP